MKTAFLPLMNQVVHFGMVAPKSPPRVLRLKNYLLGLTFVPPMNVDYYTQAGASLSRMYLNNQMGDCVIAGKAHSIGVVSTYDGGPTALFTDIQIAQYYSQLAVNPGQDTGCVISDVLDYLCNKGFVDDVGKSHKLDGYVALDVTNEAEIRVASYLFGALTIGFMVTQQMVSKAKQDAVWSNADFQGHQIVGGHDVSIVGVGPQGVRIATWGFTMWMSWELFRNTQCVTECYAPLYQTWYGSDKINKATGFDYNTLKADLDKLKQGVVPDPTPPNPVPPVPTTPAPIPPGPQPVTVDLGNGFLLSFKPTGFRGVWTTPDRSCPVGSWLSDGLDLFARIASKAESLVETYGSDALSVLAAARDAATNRDAASVTALWQAIQKLIGAKTVHRGMDLSTQVQWSAIAGEVLALLQQIRNQRSA